MIKIAGVDEDREKLLSAYPEGSLERNMVGTLSSDSSVYRYDSRDQLNFELSIRRNAVKASTDLLRSRIRFSTFRESECDEDYWDRMDNGGFRIKSGVKPSQGIQHIFRRGYRYATECATAIIIVYYKAILDVYTPDTFDMVFPGLVLMDWTHLDNPADISTYAAPSSYLPGDCRYFRNPDVDPVTPEWQGENTIMMGDNTYYGHGIGIRNEAFIIMALNRHRIDGSNVSAYLTDTVTRPSFESLYITLNKYLEG